MIKKPSTYSVNSAHIIKNNVHGTAGPMLP